MNHHSPPIALMTDFGHTDPFVGILKGVIQGIAPHTRVIDLTHGIRPQDVFQGAFTLFRSINFFPKGTIFCAVVDPGVGSHRRPIALKTRDFYFVGPDNGLLWPAAQANNVEACVCLDNAKYFLDPVSKTFHGRDIFAPVCAHLCQGIPFNSLGQAMDSFERMDIPVPEPKGDDMILRVLDRDRFGNLTLNLTVQKFAAYSKAGFTLSCKDVNITKFCRTYADAQEKIPFALAGSSGYMEIAVKNANASQWLGADVMDPMILKMHK
jgi:S-adenosylmethionine hydrolase